MAMSMGMSTEALEASMEDEIDAGTQTLVGGRKESNKNNTIVAPVPTVTLFFF